MELVNYLVSVFSFPACKIILWTTLGKSGRPWVAHKWFRMSDILCCLLETTSPFWALVLMWLSQF